MGRSSRRRSVLWTGAAAVHAGAGCVCLAGYAVAATLPPDDPLPEPVAGLAAVSDFVVDEPESEPLAEDEDEVDVALGLLLVSERLSVR